MEKITDIFKQFKDRLSNPFIFSLLISWLIWNWQLPIALFWYNNADFASYGYSGFIPYAEDFLKTRCNNLAPVLIALAYCFAFPIFRNIVLMAQSYFKSQGSRWNDRAAKDGVVRIEKYISMRNAYKERQSTLEEIIKEESSLQVKYSALEEAKNHLSIELNEQKAKLTQERNLAQSKDSEIAKLKMDSERLTAQRKTVLNDNDGLKDKIHALELSSRTDMMDGKWVLKYSDSNRGNYGVYNIDIIKGIMHFKEEASNDSYEEMIVLFQLNINSGQLTFTTAKYEENALNFEKLKYYNFQRDIVAGAGNWKGTINNNKEIDITLQNISTNTFQLFIDNPNE